MLALMMLGTRPSFLCHVRGCLVTSLTTTHQIPTVPSSYEHQKPPLDIENWFPMDKLVAQECIHPDNNAILSSETELTSRRDLLASLTLHFRGQESRGGR